MEREGRPNPETYLDTSHFDRIVRRNHAAAFAKSFPDITQAMWKFRLLDEWRQNWAHPQSRPWIFAEIEAPLDGMVGILVALQRNEALEVKAMRRNTSTAQGGDPSSSLTAHSDDAGEPMGLDMWHQLRSYLALDLLVEDIGEAHGDRNMQVTARVSNTTPIGDGQPDVHFSDVTLEVQQAGPRQSIQLGRLQPGHAIEKQFTMLSKELASVEFHVKGALDADRLFLLSRTTGMPLDVVKPLLQQFGQRFAEIQINEPSAKALATVRSLTPNVTLSKAGEIRKKLEETRALIGEKLDALNSLFRDFHLHKQSRLGAHCHEVFLVLQDVDSKVKGIDAAIGQTDAEEVTSAINSLENLQMAVLQVEETMRSLVSK